MNKKEILLGERYCMLVVVQDLGNTGKQSVRNVKVLCDCGNEKIVLLDNLKRGKTKSCGCLVKKQKGLSKTRLYNIYRTMKSRCLNKKDCNYEKYGQRGIEICNEWLNDFMEFYKWSINNGYKDNLSIDRIDNDKGYNPENCRWSNRYIQSINQRSKKNNTSGFRGISFDKKSNKWRIDICFRGFKHIGFFDNIKDAVIARNEYIINNKLPHKLNVV